jgi:hypothetical protein
MRLLEHLAPSSVSSEARRVKTAQRLFESSRPLRHCGKNARYGHP